METSPHSVGAKTGSIVGDIVRKLVFIAGEAREMFGQQFAGARDPVQDAFAEIPLAEMGGDFVSDFLPEFIAATGMNCGVSNNRKFSHARRDENQNAIFLFSLVHAQMQKRLLRGSHRVFGFLAADEDPDFAAGFLFGLTNRLDDCVVLKLA